MSEAALTDSTAPICSNSWKGSDQIFKFSQIKHLPSLLTSLLNF
jgi:hypothetical protein